MDDGDRPQSGVVSALGLIFGLLMALVGASVVLMFCLCCLFIAMASVNQLLVLAGYGWSDFYTADDPPPAWPEVVCVGVLMLSPTAMLLWVAISAMVRSRRSRVSRR